MILDAIQSKLATLRAMSNSINTVNHIKMHTILAELELLSKILANPTNYKVERISGHSMNVKFSFDNTTDGIIIEF